jgi:hypothetical protein
VVFFFTDSPFAYVLSSMADKSSAVGVEQIVGRILRRPYARRFAERFKYFMAFQTREVRGAWPMSEALGLVARL